MGGTFTAYNKIRPGAYINFETLPKPMLTVGSRGVATMPVSANWGESGKMIELIPVDMINGNYEKWFGDTDRLLFELLLSGCSKAFIWRADGGIKASAELGTLDVEAKYSGTYGNKIGVGIDADGTVTTVVDGIVIESQKISDYGDLIDNDYVSFVGSGSPTTAAITMLAGGTNGTPSYTGYFAAAQTAKWQVMAMPYSEQNASVKTLVKAMRETEGIKVQGVISSTEDVDYEGIIKVKQSLNLTNAKVTPEQLTAYVAGQTAGAEITQSNTAKKTPFISIVDEMTNSQIEENLLKGFFLFSSMADGGVKIEQDINSLTTFTPTKAKMFAKNKIIRIIDEIGNTIRATFEKSYMGKVNNNDIGRTSFKSDLIAYFNSLQALQAVQNFLPTDIVVEPGVEIDEVIVTAGVQPVDAMEKLYMTVKLS